MLLIAVLPLLLLLLLLVLFLLFVLLVLLVLLLLLLLLLEQPQGQLVVVLRIEVVGVGEHRLAKPLEGRFGLLLGQRRGARVEGGVHRTALFGRRQQRLGHIEPAVSRQRRPEVIEPVRRLRIELGRTGEGLRCTLEIAVIPMRCALPGARSGCGRWAKRGHP